ncbi:unnamed protein product [Microthlaspi erraticum]|uniref:HSF-type DNA-binding domain-containing protein n=1 Tax=Microthlaspi erraticum TaxID=1685480 RepID=A0A6D2L2F4_9BRAS|nr:unnamed protein product [Microthlaspi erraticum]
MSESSVWSPNIGASLCCKDHPKFGVCTDTSCNKWCLQGCGKEKKATEAVKPRSDFDFAKDMEPKDILSPTRNKVFDFVSKAYAMVDDPSTDSAISWSEDGSSFVVSNPAECCREIFPRLLGISDFARFERFGFTKIESGPKLGFAIDDFVRGKPELLEKIGERYVARLSEYHESKIKPLRDQVKSCKNKKEKELVYKERREKLEMQKRERLDKDFGQEIELLMKRIAKERETREAGVLSKEVEDRVKLLLALM